MLILFLFLAFDELICVVDREPITKEELSYVSTFYPGVDYEALLDKIINDKVIQYLAEEETLQVAEEEVTRMRDELALNAPGLASLLGEDEYLNEIYNEQIEVQIYTNKLMSVKLRGKLRTSPTEVHKFYQERKDSLVMPETVTFEKIQVPVLSEEDNRLLQKAKKILAEYKSGVDFVSLVKKYSEDPSTVPYGGKLGRLAPSDLPPHLAGVLNLSEKEAGIFESPTGYHIIRVDERRGINLVISQILLKFNFKEEEVKTAEERALKLKKEWVSEDSNFAYPTETVGPLPVSAIPPGLFSLIDTMDVGQVTDPVLEGLYFHLFKVVGREESRTPELSEIKDRLSNLMVQQKMMKLLNEWIEAEKRHIFIKKI